MAICSADELLRLPAALCGCLVFAGHTDDLVLRLAQHESGACGGYTATRLPVKLAWSQEFATREEALAAEQQIKGWGRAKKEALIAGDWKRIQQLAKKNFKKGKT